LVYIHIEDPQTAHIPLMLFKSNKAIRDIIEKRYLLLGLLAKSPGTQLLSKYVDLEKGPSLAIFRVNLLDDIQLLDRIILEPTTEPGQILDRLRDNDSNFVFLLAEEEKIKKDVNNSLRREKEEKERLETRQRLEEEPHDEFGNPNPYYQSFRRQPQQTMLDEQTQIKLEEARYLRKIQEEDYKEVERKIIAQKEKTIMEVKQKEQDEAKKRERKLTEENERQKKKDELAEEPKEDDPNAVQIIYRLPDGSRISRRFDKNWPVSVLYDYIDTLEIKFEDSKQYDLIQPLPFLSLENKDNKISDYFGDSNNEIIQVRERV